LKLQRPNLKSPHISKFAIAQTNSREVIKNIKETFPTETTVHNLRTNMMNKYSHSYIAPASALSFLTTQSPAHLVEEDIHDSHQQDYRDDIDTLSIPVKIVTSLQDIFRSTSANITSEYSAHDEHSNFPKMVVVSYASDSDDGDMSDYQSDDADSTTPLDYRQDWSCEMQNTLQNVLQSNALFQESTDDTFVDDDAMDCESIASIDVGSDYGDEITSPISEWINDDDVIW